MTENTDLTIKFKTKSFRKIPNPYYLSNDAQNSGPEMYVLICDVKDIPNNIPMDTNPREQKLTTGVAKKIRSTLVDPTNNSFYLLNRGLVLSAKDISVNTKTDIVDVNFSDLGVHGDVDGGHTYRIILESQKVLEYGQQFVKIEILTGIEDMFQQLAAARNTSTQVQDKSIAELYDRFEMIKRSLVHEKFSSEIYFKENDDGEIDVTDILAILNLFNISRYKDMNDVASVSYNAKKQCIDYYINDHIKYGETIDNPYFKMQEIMPTIFKLYDKIEISMREFYSNGVANKKYGSITGVITRKDGKPSFKSKFYKNKMDYLSPNGFIYPILGSFRALVGEKDGKYYWIKDPLKVVEDVGSVLVNTTIDLSRDLGNNPNATGKNKTLWKNLFMCVLMEKMK